MNLSAQIRDPLVGTRIDERYLVNGVLGRGGMGVVYEGVHERLGREVAIKVLGPGIAGDRVAVERFLREARTASQLTHGNIVDVSDLGALPDGRPYLVMARLRGLDLCSLLNERGPQTPRRTAELLRGPAAALGLIHAKGYVHRDVKPENLMHVVREDGSEAVLLLDFGIVGLVSPESQRLTAQGTVFGTPAYLSPEAIRGAPPHPLADIYALATVCFELITGHPPFASDNPLQLMQLKLARAAPSLSSVAGFELPEPVERAIAKGLVRDPAQRYSSASDLIEALERAVESHASAVLPLHAPTGGLDDGSRQRLQSGNHLEYESLRPSAAETARSEAPPEGVLEHARARRRRMLALAGVGGLLVASLAWAATRTPAKVVHEPPPQAEHRVTPSAAPQLAQPEPLAPPPPSAEVQGISAPAHVEPPASNKTVKHAGELAHAGKPLPAKTPAAPAQKAPEPAAPQPSTHAPAPSSSELVELAQRELLQGHLAAAIDAYALATRVDPHNAAAFRGLGLAHERLGHKAEALRALRQALQLAPNSPSNALLQERVRKLEGAP